MAADQPAPTIYSALRAELTALLLRPLLGPLADEAFAATAGGAARLFVRLRPYITLLAAAGDRSLLPEGASWAELLTEALERGVRSLEAQLGPELSRWHWERLHQVAAKHPLALIFGGAGALLNPPAIPVGGDPDTVAAAGPAPCAGHHAEPQTGRPVAPLWRSQPAGPADGS